MLLYRNAKLKNEIRNFCGRGKGNDFLNSFCYKYLEPRHLEYSFPCVFRAPFNMAVGKDMRWFNKWAVALSA